MIHAPKIYLVSRAAATSEIVKRALELTPVAGVIACGPDDAVAATEISDHILGLRGAPLAIVANFEHPLTVISDDSSVEILVEGTK